MPRKPRFAPPGHYLHLTQRGNYGQPTFHTDADRRVFLQLVSEYAQLRQISILAYCLMPNHYHILARATHAGDIPRFMQGVNGRYSAYLHGRLVRKGRLWQSRYYSCVLGFGHLFAALRYVECNPLRARMVDNAVTFPWSSATFHTTRAAPPPWLDMDTFRQLADPADWPSVLATPQPRAEHTLIHTTARFETATA
ncbi:MAG: transposase [Bryobacterales bacterium]|nr:transposase [Bryobacterales bacterium]